MRQDKLVIHDIPLGLWLAGIALLDIAAYLVSESAYPTAAITGFLGLMTLLLPAALTISADQNTRRLTLRYGLLVPRSVKHISFDEIDAIRVNSTTTHSHDHPTRRNSSYRLELVKKDGAALPFRIYYSEDFFLKQRCAAKLRSFIGLAETVDETPIGILQVSPKMAQPVFEKQQICETNGIRWQLQTASMGASPVTRWFSEDFKMQAGFLYLAQKMAGQPSSGGFLASIGKTLFRTSISLYGFKAEDTPGLNSAEALSPLDASLEPHFTAFTCDPAAARQILNPRIAMPLCSWAERYPIRQLQQGRFGQLVILFSPNGVYLTTPNVLQPDQMDELAALGVKLVKTQGRGA
jgi:hypothetical protein